MSPPTAEITRSLGARAGNAILLVVFYLVIGPAIGGIVFGVFLTASLPGELSHGLGSAILISFAGSYAVAWPAALATGLVAGFAALLDRPISYVLSAVTGGLAGLGLAYVSGGQVILREMRGASVGFVLAGAAAAISCRYLARAVHAPISRTT